MHFWADLAEQVRDCLVRRDLASVPALLNANFDKRREIYQISRDNLAMVAAARSVGASAKFTGSGGADPSAPTRMKPCFGPWKALRTPSA